jgi:RES domain-containing protein
MLLYRIGHTQYADDLTGEGARLHGGRWNNEGVPCIYTSTSRALALLEYTCHVKRHLIPRDLSFVTYGVPENCIKIFKVSDLPGNWKNWPHAREPRDLGTAFLKANDFLLYGFPSAVIEEEMNYLINPLHKDITQVNIMETKDYMYDLRIKIA